MVKVPQFLERGMKAAVVSPSGCITVACLQRALETLNRWGLEPVVGPHVLKRCGPMAGSDEERLADLQAALDDPEIRVIITTRGGYGCGRIIDRLDFTRFKQNPKWITGFSDITVLHSYLQNEGIASLHGCMPQTYPGVETPEYNLSVETLKKALFGELLQYGLDGSPANRRGTVQAPLAGGNLSMLYSQRGTPTDIDPSGKILFIEDLDEFDYHIDRMLSNLARAGWFARISGLIVGSFTQIKPGANPWNRTVAELIRPYVEPYDYPVCFDFPAGHIAANGALYFGVPALLEVGERTQLTFKL